MTTTPPDPLATQHGSTTDPDSQAPVDEQTLRLREENRALRELLAAQAAIPSQEPGLLRRLCWWLISAPGAALVGWRSLLGRDGGQPITGKRVGYATLTVLYTLAIYGALVLLVVSWSSPSTPRSGASAAGPVRVPLAPLPNLGAEGADSEARSSAAPGATSEAGAGTTPDSVSTEPPSAPGVTQEHAGLSDATTSQAVESALESTQAPAVAAAPESSPVPTEETAGASGAVPAAAGQHAGPQSTLRMTEIPAEDPLAWLGELRRELARCAELGFFERPDCAWEARKQFCEPRRAWGTVQECPTRP